MTAFNSVPLQYCLRQLWTIVLLCVPIGSFAAEFVFEGEFGSPGTAVGQFSNPRAIAVDAQNRIVIADRENHRIQICTDQGMCTAFGQLGNAVGEFNLPQGVTVDSQDRIFVVDNSNNRVQICNHQGVCTGFNITSGHGLAVDSQDRIILTDNFGNQIHICNESGTCTSFGGPGIESGQFDQPFTVATDSHDRIFIADKGNNRIQMCDDQGNCQAFGVPGTGPGEFSEPTSIAVDNLDRVIVGDRNDRIQIFSVQVSVPTVTVVAASATYPAGTFLDGFTSMTDDPLGPFSGQSVTFRGTGAGGDQQVYRYRIDFDQDVTLDSIVVEGAAWRDSTIGLFNAQGGEIRTIKVTGGNSLFRHVLYVPGTTGRTFFLEEFNEDSSWRYRSSIEINLATGMSTNTIDVNIRALIDGRSQIKIQDNQLWWHHIQAAAPGRHQGRDEPTFVNGFDWLPVWPFNDEGRDCDCESDKFDLTNAGLQLPNDVELLELRLLDIRDTATIIQSPSVSNGFLSIIELDDQSGGSYWFDVIAVFGTASSIIVPGTSNPWLAGAPDGSMARGGDVAPDQSPVLVPTPFTPGAALSFSATGLASNDVGGGFGPDGDVVFQFHGAENGMPDGNMPLSALAGVFLSPSQPDPSSLPPNLDFGASGNVADGINYTNLSPQLRQVFFVGDGQTDGGVTQQVIPPAGATRLFLGIMDGSQYNNNSGSFEVDVSDGTPPINEVPIAVNDVANADTGVSVIISVLDNDQGLADMPIVVTISADPTDGTAIAGADNKVTYTSNAGFVGDDEFEYTATDRDGDASNAIVTVTVVDPNVNTVPTAVDDMANVDSGATVTINVLANDQGLADVPIVVSISLDPDNGSAQALADNRISYTADNNFIGNDSFEYTVTDSDGDASTATVSLTVTDPNAGGGAGHQPAAVNDSMNATSGGNIVIDVLSNDQGLADEPIEVKIWVDPSNGSAFVLADNRISYTADSGFVGDDNFQYSVTDRDGETSIATVAVKVVSAAVADETDSTTTRSVKGGLIDPVSLLLLFGIYIWSYTARRRAFTFDLQ